MKKSRIAILAATATAVALALSSAPAANAGAKPANKANVGDECLRAGVVAKGRGVNGTNLTCTAVTTGSFANSLRWWYPDMKPLTSLEFVASSAIGGGYGTTAIAIGDAMKKEGLLKDYTVTYRTNAPLGFGYFTEQKNRNDLWVITGFAMPGGLATNGSKLSILDTKPLAGIMRESEIIVTSPSSPYRNISDFLTALKANPKGIAIGGGNYGGVDHVAMGILVNTAGVKPADINYIPYSGGAAMAPDAISGRLAVGIAGTAEVASYVAAGQLRVLGLTSAKPLAAVKGKTLVQQKIDLIFGNWRGILAPADLSAADYLNQLKVVDTLHSSPAWKDTMAAKSWIDDYRVGDSFKTWLTKENADILKTLTDFKLLK